MASLLLALLMGSGRRGYSFVGSTSYAELSSLSTATVDMSSITDLRAGDYIFCCISLVDAIVSDVSSMPANDSSSSGLTLQDAGFINGTNDTLLAVYSGFYTGTLSSGNLTVALPRANRQAITVHVFRGIKKSTPIDGRTSANSATNGQPNPPSGARADGQFIFSVGAMNGPASTTEVTDAGFLSEFESALSGSSRRSSIGAGYGAFITNPGAFGGGSTSTSATYLAFTYTVNGN